MDCPEHWADGLATWRNERMANAKRHLLTPVAGSGKRMPFISIFLMLIAFSHVSLALLTTPLETISQIQALSKRAANDSSLLECLQVAPPVLSPAGGCQQTLMVHTFAYSYGQPFIGEYNPPACDFNRVTFNFTVTSAGRQFDRLALMYLGDIEIWRLSTAEPTRDGIIWTYVKDMSPFTSLLQEPQKIIFDLGNIVDDTYTGLWNTTLTATFFTAEETFEPADLILPVSARKSATNEPSAFIVPESNATNALLLPRNAKKAVFTISACGQAAEEFWWSNVLTSDEHAFGNDTTLYGHSAFRELQLVIDGNLAGVAWPFPIIFTGGIVPGFWRPVVGIDAFDLREDEIDLTPFIPYLSDGQSHTFEIRVVGVDDDGQGHGSLTTAIESNWVVTGKLFLWLDANTTTIAGGLPTIQAPKPSIELRSSTQRGPNGTTNSLVYSIEVSRELYIERSYNTSVDSKSLTWEQKLSFSNSGTLSNGGNDQVVQQSTSGSHVSSSGFQRAFTYPLAVESSYNAVPGGNTTIDGHITRSKDYQQVGDLAYPNDWQTFDYTRLPPALYNHSFIGAQTKNWQNGTASYLSVPAQKKSYGTGRTEQQLTLSGIDELSTAVTVGGTSQAAQEVYRRHVLASNDSLVYDDEEFGGRVMGRSRYVAPNQLALGRGWNEFAWKGIRALLGRGPL